MKRRDFLKTGAMVGASVSTVMGVNAATLLSSEDNKKAVPVRIALGGDHAGFELKNYMKSELERDGHIVTDFGSYTPDPVDFPDIAKKICAAILSGEADRGIMCCGSGVGASIACNKVKGIRASVCHDIFTAHQCVEHDDVQVAAFGNQIIGKTAAIELARLFLAAKFSTSEEFRRRVAKLDEMDSSK
ncbi:MAG: RpiB/LacA/LacB family sugar-phosphate isomerase [Tannerella sp.]|jgi:ribose 5-phosphate isomerase B|nr:RpiB/LacA/LacB family sugar-phosphate isomerase [Tannerella sp.]